MRPAQVVIGVLAFVAVGSWGAFLLTGGLAEPATAWAPSSPVVDEAPPRPGLSRVMYAQKPTEDGWIEWVSGTHVEAVPCGDGVTREAVAKQVSANSCEGGQPDHIQVERLDDRLDLGRCVTEVRLRVSCSS